MFKKPMLLKPIALALLLAAPLVQAATGVGEIVALAGHADYRETDQAAWRPATLRQPVAAASFVRTGDMSAASVLLSDQSQVKLGQNTVFQVRNVSSANNRQNGTVLALQTGRAWAQTKNAGLGLTMTTPTVAAGIHGTDWVMEVDDVGRSTMTVLSGVVELSNPQGRIDVYAGEQGYAEAGKAPVKRVLVNARERVQWVSTHRINFGLYPELSQQGTPQRAALADSLKHAEFATALSQASIMRRDAPEPAAWLLGGELALVAGDAPGAEFLLKEGAGRYPNDRRFTALLATTALFQDQPESARNLLTPLVAKHPDFVDGWLAKGELERLDGNGPAAAQAYSTATNLAPADPRGWLGLGKVETERERVRTAIVALDKAAETGGAGYEAAERGTLSTFNDKPADAAREFDAALKKDPADYVAWTGLGISRLKAGDNDGALDALLRATVIEPRYARAALYSAIAYYRQGKTKAALETLHRATELDPNDPLPHLYAALIKRDEWLPAEALADAKLANQKMPKLKSLNQLSNDQQGSANLGGTLADLGLETWAGALAQDSALSTWAGSHLFLADRYKGSFDRNSELMQGFLADPTVFGANNRRQSLVTEPGIYGDIGLSGFTSNSANSNTESLSINGYQNKYLPIAAFTRLQRIKLTPKSSSVGAGDYDATIGLGVKPRYDLGLFLYATRVKVDIQDASGENPPYDTDGRAWRYDVGTNWRYSPDMNVTVKMGESAETTRFGSRVKSGYNVRTPDSRDYQASVYSRLSPMMELAGGYESVKNDYANFNVLTSQAQRPNSPPPPLSTFTDDYRTRDRQLWAQLRVRSESGHRFEALLADHNNDQMETTTNTITPFGGATRYLQNPAVVNDKHQVDVRLGISAKLADVATVRLAWQDWIRPNGFNTLMPVADAGIPLADQYILPGGRERRARGQLEWNLNERTFVQGFVERVRVNNTRSLVESLDNSFVPLAELDTLNGAKISNLPTAEALEGRPLFESGRITQYGFSISHVLPNGLAAEAGYVHAKTVHLQSPLLNTAVEGNELPYFPTNRFAASLAGSHGSWRWQVQAVYRGDRYQDDFNNQLLEADWVMNARLAWRSSDRGWLLELVGDELGQNTSRVGVSARYRF